MVYAKTQASAAWFSREIQQGNLKKEYLAVVRGAPEADSGELNDLLLHDVRKNKSYVVNRMRGGVKKARLSYAVLEKQPDRTLVQVRLFTGRTHQIRVQFASRKLPLMGDGRYGGGSGELALWSVRLTFRYHGKELCFTEKPDSLGGFCGIPRAAYNGIKIQKSREIRGKIGFHDFILSHSIRFCGQRVPSRRKSPSGRG